MIVNQISLEHDKISLIKKTFLLCALFHLVAVIFCVGFYHFDEHFQILEFLSFKLGSTKAESLTWEFSEKIRPWLQPALSFVIVKFLSLINIDNRFFLAGVFRLLSSAIGLLSLYLTALCAPLFFSEQNQTALDNRKYFYFVLSLTWFYPFLHARHSADNWGASLFIIALSLNFILLKMRENISRPNYLKPSHAVLIGVIFGVAFLSRYQLGIAILSIYTWWLLIGKLEIKSGLLMTSGLFIALFIGIIIDSWGYGSFTFAPWNYLYADFVLHVKGNHLPTPWYSYFGDALRKGGGPIAAFLMIGVVLFWIRFKRDFLTAVTLPLFIIHSLIGHKELRFLMLIIYLSPIMTYRVWVDLDWSKKKWAKWTLKIIVALNFLFLGLSIFTPANVAPLFYKKVASFKVEKFYYQGEDPYTMLGLPVTFYGDKIERLPFDLLANHQKDFWLVTTKGEQLQSISQYDCQDKYSVYPLSLIMRLPTKIINRSRVWVLHFCQGN